MTWVAVAIGGAAVVGAGASFMSGDKQRQSANKASDVQRQMQLLQMQQLQPYTQGGLGALSGLQRGLGTNTPGAHGYDPNAPLMRPFSLQDFQQDPSYQFNLSQGLQAVNKAAAARGGGNFYAPQTLQDIGKFSQGLASNEYWNAQNAFQRNQQMQYGNLYNLAGIGQASAAGVGAGALQTGGMIGNNLTGAGNAQAGGIMGASNAITGGIGQGYNAYLLNSILQQSQGGGGVPYGGAVPGGMEIPQGYTAGGMPTPMAGF